MGADQLAEAPPEFLAFCEILNRLASRGRVLRLLLDQEKENARGAGGESGQMEENLLEVGSGSDSILSQDASGEAPSNEN
jgi:hypothetical protein